jgi:RNA polymerase sigma-B factor
MTPIPPRPRLGLRGAAVAERRDSESRRSTRADTIEDLVTQHLGLARRLAWRYAGRGELMDDLIQVANVGLVSAARRYDRRRGIAFDAYASRVITGELKRHFRDHVWALHVPRSKKELALAVSREVREHLRHRGVMPSTSELAQRLDLTERQICDADEAWSAFYASSFEAPARASGDPDCPPLSEVIGSTDSEFELVDRRVTRLVASRRLSVLERRMFYMRYFEDRSQHEIAARVGVSQAHVSRVLRRIVKHLDLAADGRGDKRVAQMPLVSTRGTPKAA